MYSYCMHWASVNSVVHGASAQWGVQCTLPFQQPVLLCLCVNNMLYVCISSVQLYYHSQKLPIRFKTGGA